MHGQPKTLGRPSDIQLGVAAEFERMGKLVKRVGARLQHHLTRTADDRTLPDEDWRETARWYTNAVIALQRYAADAPVSDDASKMSDADYEKELDIIARETLRKMTPAERREFLQEVEHEPARPGSTPSGLDPAPDRLPK